MIWRFIYLLSIWNLLRSGYAFYTAISPKIMHPLRLQLTLENERPFNIRNAKGTDMNDIAILCSQCFDGYSAVEKKKNWLGIDIFPDVNVKNYEDQLRSRYNRIHQGDKHAMFVACSSVNGSIVGFVEIGMLPNPLGIDSDLQEMQNVEIPSNATDSIQNDDIHTSSSTYYTYKRDVPYLGNIAVSKDFRRFGIGSKLALIGCKLVQKKWDEEYLYIAVDHTNNPAIQMYLKLRFEIILDERLRINQPKDKTPRLFMRKHILAT